MSTVRSRIKSQHAEKVLASLDKLRAWEWEWTCNFTIQVGNESYPVHRTVLASCSKYFFDLFKRNGEEVKEGGIEITGLTATTAKLCIEFMYSGVADITLENVDHVLLAARIFKLGDLKKLCLDFLSRNLSVENCLYVKMLYKKFGFIKKGRDLEKFIAENFYNLVSTISFLSLKKDEVLPYLQAPNIDHKSIWQGIITWIKFRENERKKHYFEFLSLITTKFPPEFLLGTVWPDRFTKESKPSKDLLATVLLSGQKKINSEISIENCFLLKQLYEPCHHANSRQAHNQVLLFMMDNFEKIADRDEIVDLSKDEIFQIFHSLETKYSSEVTKWEVAIKWTKHNLLHRRRFFPDLIAAIKLENLPLNFIKEVVRPEPLVYESKECNQLLLDILLARAHQEEPDTSIKFSPLKRSAKEETVPKAAELIYPKICITTISPSPSKKIKMAPKTNRHIQEEFSSADAVTINPETQVSFSHNMYLAVYDSNSGKVEGLDLETLLWKHLAVTKVTKDEFQGITSVANKLYLLKGGGLFLLDGKNGWSKLTSKPTKPNAGAKMVAFQNSIYIVQNGFLSHYDLHSNTWTENGPFILSGNGFCVCASNMYIFILGGSQNPTRARKYDPLSAAISEIQPLINARHGAAATLLNDKVYIMGGAIDGQPTMTMDTYDPGEDLWTVVPNMQVQRSNFCACAYGGKMYALGGSESANNLDSVEVYEVVKGKYKWRIVHSMLISNPQATACVVEIPST